MDDKYKNIGNPITCLMEECAEVIHICCKIQRFGMDNYHPKDESKTTNKQLLQNELKDLQYRIEELNASIR